MTNEKEYWENLSKRIKDPVEAKNKKPDTTDVEMEFLKDFVKPGDSVLDLGAGSGLITNQLLDLVNNIVAVEKFEGFSKFIKEDPNMLVINSDIVGFKMRKQFDMILCTGVGQCVRGEDMKEVYKSIASMLNPEGVFVTRMHCGINEDVIVDSFSEELGSHYYAEFRQKDNEAEFIKEAGFKSVEIFDFLPDSINVWDNSRHYYFVCRF